VSELRCKRCDDPYEREQSTADTPGARGLYCSQECAESHRRQGKAEYSRWAKRQRSGNPFAEDGDEDNPDKLFADDIRARRRELLVEKAAREQAENRGEPGIRDGLLTRDQLAELPKPEWLIQGILARHSYAVLSGRRSTYKSFLALDWALSLATKRPWQGRSTERVRTLYVVGEGAFGLDQRVTAWERAWQLEVDPDWFVTYPQAVNLFKGGRVGELVQIIQDDDFGLVVFDTLRRMTSGADANSERDMGPVVDRIERVKRATAGGSVLLVAHTDKGNNGTRGSSVIEDDADIVWRTDLDEEGRLKLRCSKMKDAPDGAVLDLRGRAAHGAVIIEAGTDDAGQPSTESQIKVLDTLRFNFPDGAYGGALRRVSGLTERTFYRAVAELMRAGHIAKSGSVRSPFYTLSPSVTATNDA
jgi:hypothetical protein